MGFRYSFENICSYLNFILIRPSNKCFQNSLVVFKLTHFNSIKVKLTKEKNYYKFENNFKLTFKCFEAI